MESSFAAALPSGYCQDAALAAFHTCGISTPQELRNAVETLVYEPAPAAGAGAGLPAATSLLNYALASKGFALLSDEDLQHILDATGGPPAAPEPLDTPLAVLAQDAAGARRLAAALDCLRLGSARSLAQLVAACPTRQLEWLQASSSSHPEAITELAAHALADDQEVEPAAAGSSQPGSITAARGAQPRPHQPERLVQRAALAIQQLAGLAALEYRPAGAVLFTAPHGVWLQRDGCAEHLPENGTTQLARSFAAAVRGSYCVWGEAERNKSDLLRRPDPANRDPNFLAPAERAHSPWHAVLRHHAVRHAAAAHSAPTAAAAPSTPAHAAAACCRAAQQAAASAELSPVGQQPSTHAEVVSTGGCEPAAAPAAWSRPRLCLHVDIHGRRDWAPGRDVDASDCDLGLAALVGSVAEAALPGIMHALRATLANELAPVLQDLSRAALGPVRSVQSAQRAGAETADAAPPSTAYTPANTLEQWAAAGSAPAQPASAGRWYQQTNAGRSADPAKAHALAAGLHSSGAGWPSEQCACGCHHLQRGLQRAGSFLAGAQRAPLQPVAGNQPLRRAVHPRGAAQAASGPVAMDWQTGDGPQAAATQLAQEFVVNQRPRLAGVAQAGRLTMAQQGAQLGLVSIQLELSRRLRGALRAHAGLRARFARALVRGFEAALRGAA